MTREAIFEELTEIFRDIFDDEEIELTDETTADDIEDWDSLEQINLLVAIEKKFSIKFKLDEDDEMIRAVQNSFGDEVFNISLVGKVSVSMYGGKATIPYGIGWLLWYFICTFGMSQILRKYLGFKQGF